MKLYKNLLILLLFILTISTNCFALTVGAAISLQNPLKEIARTYPGEISFVWGATGDIIKQINAGAPIDMLAALYDKKYRELQLKPVYIATNTLVLALSKKSPIRITSIEELNKVSLFSVGNPATVPLGEYGEQVLKHYKLYDSLKKKIIYCTNAAQVISYLTRGEVDGAFVYKTDFDKVKDNLIKVTDIDAKIHAPIIYAAGVTKVGADNREAEKFLHYLKSEKARSVFRRFGFGAIND
ncbi:MAG: molybdate ABC transporter substrate-binding protein [Candidatus Margulisiibacteriota bacterium]|nr:MAG: molybdate ABC transporter substrate-binding protein [Candidatus Margulisbacteria bacterium GWD2_39_127]OGI01827.1 MAG: molybdate ABC transporter substrate-binding protein [Candidatus Margulisbacteria bacterium GWF2_38_17]OGI10149.1 MAG: molybdate ABC transporter substrate-binding protein [Candidatus Margulisbacteria bacterium GWE2_39_32]PZM79513.1 MAG: molybdate ABC transporter substrate-binding protein [Candidatus Margulisiibacteriota bacterium]HAR63814.1 molybdate ABC transporter subs